MPASCEISAAVFGAGSLDVYAKPGQVGPNHRPGAKIDWGEQEPAMFAALLASGAEQHAGGNGLNFAAWRAANRGPGDRVRFVSVRGVGDPASTMIGSHIAAMSIEDLSVIVPGYRPSVSIIEQLDPKDHPGSPRMVRGRPRDPMGQYIDGDTIRGALKGADIVTLASLKDDSLRGQILRDIPEGVFVSINPGSSEYGPGHVDSLREQLRERPVTLLAANEDEAEALMDTSIRTASGQVDIDQARRLVDQVTGLYAGTMLLTAGRDGMVLGSDGQSEYAPEPDVPLEQVICVLGAGDCAHAIVADQLYRGAPKETALFQASIGIARVIRRRGAHGYLYEAFYTTP